MFVSKHTLIKACFRVVDLFPAEVNLVASLLRQIRVSKHTLSAYFRGADLFLAEVNLVASLLRQIRVSKLPHRDMRACSEFCDSGTVFKSVLRACSASSECAHANTMHVSWGESVRGKIICEARNFLKQIVVSKHMLSEACFLPVDEHAKVTA